MSDANTQPVAPAPSAQSNDNVMAAVATIPLVGLIIYFAMQDASDLVKFYAKQSIGLLLVSIVVSVINFVVLFIPYIGGLLSCVTSLLSLGVFALWLILAINAFQGKKFRLPVVADLVDQFIK